MDIVIPPARERILMTAHDLFYREGIRCTGIDRIIAESGVAKVTFYRHFVSKDALVRAFLEYRHERWMAWFIDALGRHGAQPGGGLRPLQAALAEWFIGPDFRGCAFINTVVELGAQWPEAVGIAGNHKEEMAAVLADLLGEGPSMQANARAVATAVDGAIVQAQLGSAKEALAALSLLLAPFEPMSTTQPAQNVPGFVHKRDRQMLASL
jgi:AcrR family transcriptional regulator